MFSDAEIVNMIICFGVCSFFGMVSLFIIIRYMEKDNKRIMRLEEDVKSNCIAISGDGNTVKGRKNK